MNILQITDSLGVASGVGEGLFIQLNTGGSTVTGGRNAVQGDMTITARTGNANGQYTGVTGNAFLPTGVSEPNGIIYGMNATAQLFTGASLGTGSIVGMEINAGAQSGTTYGGAVGLQIVPFGNWVTSGSTGTDSALAFGDQGQTSGWDYFISIAGVNPGRFGAKASATLMAALTPGTLARGFNLSNITFTDYAWYSSTFLVFGATTAQGASIATQAGMMLGTGVTAGNPVNVTTANGSNIVIAPGGSGNTQVVGPFNLANATLTGNLTMSAAAGVTPLIQTAGADANVSLSVSLKGTSNFNIISDGAQSAQVTSVAGSDSWPLMVPGIAASRVMQITTNGVGNNLLLGGPIGGGGVAAAATTGFPMIPVQLAAPTGTPVNSGAGCAMAVNLPTRTLNIYVPSVGWYHATLTAGAA
jgi:hypothetical protein